MTILAERYRTIMLARQDIHCCPQELDDCEARDDGGDGYGCTLCSELMKLEQLKEQLTHQTAQLRVKINQSHSTINRQLPPEILATIFQAVVEDSSYYDMYNAAADIHTSSSPAPFFLGAVCRNWRDVAWSTPRLWSSITIHVDWRPDGHATQKLLTTEWLSRSGQLPLSIRILDDLKTFHRTEDINIAQSLIEIVNQYSPRWHNLILDLPQWIFPWFMPVGNAAPLLEYLTVEEKQDYINYGPVGDDDPEMLNFGNTPSLKYLVARHISLNCFKLDWSTITHFSAEGVSDFAILEILRKAPFLEYAAFHTLSGASSNPEPPSTPVIAQHLHTLNLTFSNGNGSAFIDNVTCPVLETLSVVGAPPGRLPSFFERSDFALQSLALSLFIDDPNCLIKLLQSQPSLTKLHLGWSQHLNVLLDELNRGADQDMLLPNLETLECMGVILNCKWERFEDLFSGASPSPRPWRNIQLTLIQDLDMFATAGRSMPYIPEPVLSCLQSAKANGIDLDFRIASGSTSDPMKDLIQVSEEWHEVQRQYAAMVKL